tara:strand:- start:106 stop:351 length:246 start_codon:yes stop_codon:yes gene_type:complete
MRQLKSFCEVIAGFCSYKKKPTDDITSVLPHLPTLSKGEVLLKKSKVEGTFDVFTIEALTPEQLDMLARGEIPKGLTAYYI